SRAAAPLAAHRDRSRALRTLGALPPRRRRSARRIARRGLGRLRGDGRAGARRSTGGTGAGTPVGARTGECRGGRRGRDRRAHDAAGRPPGRSRRRGGRARDRESPDRPVAVRDGIRLSMGVGPTGRAERTRPVPAQPCRRRGPDTGARGRAAAMRLAVAGLIALLTGPVFGADGPPAWLPRAAAAAPTAGYHGEVTHRHEDRVQTLEIARRAGPAGYAERILTLSGSPREVVRDGRTITCVLPADASADGRLPRNPFPVVSAGAIFDRYEVRDLGEDRIAG